MLVSLDEIRRERAGVDPEWDYLDEGLGDWIRKAGKKIKGIFKKKEPQKVKKEKPKRVKKEKPWQKPKARLPRPPPLPGGIPKKPKPQTVDKEVERKAAREVEKRKRDDKFKAAYKRPDDLDPAISHPKEVKRRKRGEGPINHSDMYKHVVRAVYNRITSTGYPTRGTPAHAAQAIARGRMIGWGYAKRKSTKGGVTDRRTIELTPMGQARSWRKHAQEGPGRKKAKNLDYNAIVAKDPY